MASWPTRWNRCRCSPASAVRLFERPGGQAVAISAVRGAARVTERRYSPALGRRARDRLRQSRHLGGGGEVGTTGSWPASPVSVGDGLAHGRAWRSPVARSARVSMPSPSRSVIRSMRNGATIAASSWSPCRRHRASCSSASPGDWESRFLYRVLRDVTDLPVEGFVELTRGTVAPDVEPAIRSTRRRCGSR